MLHEYQQNTLVVVISYHQLSFPSAGVHFLFLLYYYSFSCYFCCLIVVKYIFHSFSYLCIILFTLRRWGKSAAIQELYSCYELDKGSR